MREIAVAVSNDNIGIAPFETISAIKEAGFKNVFVQWYNKDWECTQEEQLKYINELGLNVIFAHLGYYGFNSIWEENEAGNLLVERYINDIGICKKNNIPFVIMHPEYRSTVPLCNEIGLNRIKKIVDYAKNINMKIAFENIEIKGYLEYILTYIKDDNVGICFDSGHYHTFFDDEFNFKLFKNRILAVHLHDNDKSADLHLLPFDGTIDWDCIVKELKDNNYNGPITLELCYRYEYLSLSPLEFYKKGYEIGEKLAEMFERQV